MNHANAHIHAVVTVIAPLVWNITARTDQEQIAEKTEKQKRVNSIAGNTIW